MLDVTFPRRETALATAEEIARRAALFKLAHFDLSGKATTECQQIAAAPALGPPEKGLFASHAFSWFYPVRQDAAFYPVQEPSPAGARSRESLLDDVRSRVAAARDREDYAPVMSPAGAEAADRLRRSVPDLASDLEVAWALGWFHWLRVTQLGPRKGDHDATLATELFRIVYRTSAGDIPPTLLQAFFEYELRPDAKGPDEKPGECDEQGRERYQEYERTRDLGTLTDAVRLARQAVDGTPNDHPDRAGYLCNLLGIQQALFEHTGDLNALIEAAESGREALSCLDVRHPRHDGGVQLLAVAHLRLPPMRCRAESSDPKLAWRLAGSKSRLPGRAQPPFTRAAFSGRRRNRSGQCTFRNGIGSLRSAAWIPRTSRPLSGTPTISPMCGRKRSTLSRMLFNGSLLTRAGKRSSRCSMR